LAIPAGANALTVTVRDGMHLPKAQLAAAERAIQQQVNVQEHKWWNTPKITFRNAGHCTCVSRWSVALGYLNRSFPRSTTIEASHDCYGPVYGNCAPYAAIGFRRGHAAGWSRIVSKEVLEMIENPHRRTSGKQEIAGPQLPVPPPLPPGAHYIGEPDPVAEPFANSGYRINGVLVQAFATPNFFDGGPSPTVVDGAKL
jgi:hypothetical protein